MDIKVGEEIATPNISVAGLVSQESEENARHHGNLAYPKYEHPFNQFRSNLSYFFGQPSFKLLFGKNNDIFFYSLVSLINDVYKGVSALIGETLTKNFGDRYNSHVPYFSASLIPANSITAPYPHVNTSGEGEKGEKSLQEGKILVFLANGEGNLAANLLKAQDEIKTLKENLEELKLEFSKLRNELTKAEGQAE